MMKRKHSEGRLNPTFQQDVQSSKLPYVSDPKLIARVQQVWFDVGDNTGDNRGCSHTSHRLLSAGFLVTQG